VEILKHTYFLLHKNIIHINLLYNVFYFMIQPRAYLFIYLFQNNAKKANSTI